MSRSCPTCSKPNCGNWAACAHKIKNHSERKMLGDLVWYLIGVTEAVVQGVSKRIEFSLTSDEIRSMRLRLWDEELTRLRELLNV